MNQIVGLLYTILVIGLSGAAVFITYHILRYSLSKKKAFEGSVLFLAVFVFLLFTNMILFSQLDWGSIFETTVNSSL